MPPVRDEDTLGVIDDLKDTLRRFVSLVDDELDVDGDDAIGRRRRGVLPGVEIEAKAPRGGVREGGEAGVGSGDGRARARGDGAASRSRDAANGRGGGRDARGGHRQHRFGR